MGATVFVDRQPNIRQAGANPARTTDYRIHFIAKKERRMSSTEPDPNLYAELCSQRFTAEEVDTSLQAFWDEVYELRRKYKLRDVSIVVGGDVAGQGPFMWSAHAGNEAEAETMAAWHLGMTQSRRQERIRETLELALTDAIKVGKRNRR